MRSLLCSLLFPCILSAQVAVADFNGAHHNVQFVAKNHKFSFDLNAIALSLNYVKKMSGHWFWGVGGGGGLDVLNTTVWDSDQLTVELLHAELFTRYQKSDYWEIDLGGRISYVGYSTSLIEHGIQDKGGFFGVYTSAAVGFHNVKIGTRVLFGHLSNLRDRSDLSAILFPMVRLTLRW